MLPKQFQDWLLWWKTAPQWPDKRIKKIYLAHFVSTVPLHHYHLEEKEKQVNGLTPSVMFAHHPNSEQCSFIIAGSKFWNSTTVLLQDGCSPSFQSN